MAKTSIGTPIPAVNAGGHQKQCMPCMGKPLGDTPRTGKRPTVVPPSNQFEPTESSPTPQHYNMAKGNL